MKIKKSFVIFGVVMAVMGTLFASALPWRYSRRAHALVLVKDPSNIEEAIKMVNHLTNLLSNEQMQLALQILQMKKLDENTLFGLWNIAKDNTKLGEMIAKGESGKWGDLLVKVDGMLSGNVSIPTTWQEGLGEVTDILDGQLSQANGGCFGNGRAGMVVVNDILKGTATVAQLGQVSDVQVMKMVSQAAEAGRKAEGEVQALQAGNAINEGNALLLQNGNRLLYNMGAAFAAKNQREVAKDAWEMRINSETAAHAWTVGESIYHYSYKTDFIH